MSDTNSYHHGDLRTVLIEAAESELERTGYETLSLRQLAIAVGVSHGAPYRHFQNREALLLELVSSGIRDLEQSYAKARQSALTPRERLMGVCRSYLELAAAKPELFRLMFVSSFIYREWGAVLRTRFTVAFEHFRQAVAEALGASDAQVIDHEALFIWSAIHGLALLRMAGRFERFRVHGESDDALMGAVLDKIARRGPPFPA